MMKSIQRSIEYHSLRLFAAAVRLLPLPGALFLARRLADLVFYLVPVRKRVVIDNLSRAFPEKTPADILRIAHGVYRQFSQTMMELLFFPKFTGARLLDMVDFSGIETVERALAEGKGAVLVGAHFGNWELMGAALAQKYPVSFVVGQQENTRVDDLLNSFRTGKGVSIIPLKMALRGVMKALRNNEFIAILADQDAHGDGAFVPFFGRPASTPKGPAVFALRAGCPVIMGTIVREGNGRFTVAFERIPAPVPSGDEENDITAYTAAFTAVLERNTREHPDHWFWMHRRWKTKVNAR